MYNLYSDVASETTNQIFEVVNIFHGFQTSLYFFVHIVMLEKHFLKQYCVLLARN
jgi:hypothetical protein